MAFSEKLILLYDAVQRGNVAGENIYDSLCEVEEEGIDMEETQVEIVPEVLPIAKGFNLKNYKEMAVAGFFTLGIAMVLWAICFW